MFKLDKTVACVDRLGWVAMTGTNRFAVCGFDSCERLRTSSGAQAGQRTPQSVTETSHHLQYEWKSK
jgi:hypothetical protein